MGEEYPFPFPIRDLTDEERRVTAWSYVDNKGAKKVKFVGTRACCLDPIRQLGTVLYNFKPRPDDIWLLGFVRTGTTLVQEILYLLGTDLNYEKAASEIMDIRFPPLHAGLHKNQQVSKTQNGSPQEDKSTMSPHEYLEKSNEKRFIKSHYGFNMLHPKILEIGCKIVFIARNPKDVIVSFSRFPFFANAPDYKFEKVWNLFKHDMVACGNYFEMLQEVWERKNNKNILILLYEEINADKRAAILKIADFVGQKLTNDELETLLNHVDIDSFKTNKSLNNDHLVDVGLYGKNSNFSFIRKGKSGGWRDVIPPTLVEEIDEWAKKNFAAIPNFEIPQVWIDEMDLKL